MGLQKKIRKKSSSRSLGICLCRSYSIRMSFSHVCPSTPRKCLPFMSQDAGPSLAQNSKPFNSPDSKRTHYTAVKRSYAATYPRLLNSFIVGSLRSRTSTLLRRATPQNGVLHRCVGALIYFSFSSLLRVFPSRYLASFLLIITPCPAKHDKMEDKRNISDYECESCH